MVVLHHRCAEVLVALDQGSLAHPLLLERCLELLVAAQQGCLELLLPPPELLIVELAELQHPALDVAWGLQPVRSAPPRLLELRPQRRQLLVPPRQCGLVQRLALLLLLGVQVAKIQQGLLAATADLVRGGGLLRLARGPRLPDLQLQAPDPVPRGLEARLARSAGLPELALQELQPRLGREPRLVQLPLHALHAALQVLDPVAPGRLRLRLRRGVGRLGKLLS
mmetsp:Transcript_23350/g.66522  ORF Transcript_23350/g.66522 Transcript_23350/m.66522 type:complete len:224 (-) Transcript_23350:495-1166(-)